MKYSNKKMITKSLQEFECRTQWQMCSTPPPRLPGMKPVLRSLAGLDSTTAAAAAAINAITAFSVKFSRPIFF